MITRMFRHSAKNQSITAQPSAKDHSEYLCTQWKVLSTHAHTHTHTHRHTHTHTHTHTHNIYIYIYKVIWKYT